MTDQYLSQTQTQKQLQILAPQLRQGLEILQVPLLELRALIDTEMEQNPTLDEQPSEVQEQVEIEPGSTKDEENEEPELDFSEEFEVLARLDDEWKDYFREHQTPIARNPDEEERRQFFLDSMTQSTTLQEHLMNQLSFSGLGQSDKMIAEMLIGSLDDNGFLSTPLDELSQGTGYPIPHLEAVLSMIQDFDPIGVAARDLPECLLLQLRRLNMATSPAADMVRDHLQLLGSHKYQDIARAMNLSLEEVTELAQFIGRLEPRPGQRFTNDDTEYVVPEITIQKMEGRYVVFMNDESLPRLRISRHYRQIMEDPNASRDVKSYIAGKIKAGTFLIRSINQRQTTIRNIAERIVEVQNEFFDHGISHLRPLTMAEVAGKIGVHETTVSRAISGKYMQTPQGVFEMKYFFTPGFKTADGQSISNKSIKDAIQRLVDGENPAKPLSDQAMVKELAESGIKVARRTVAKYREELHILPSHLRKQHL